jgi:hypothetical protein
MKADGLCHRSVRATNGHLITPSRSGNELAPVQSIGLHLLTLARQAAYQIGELQVRGSLHCEISSRLWTGLGQTRLLPRRNMVGCFSSISRHCARATRKHPSKNTRRRRNASRQNNTPEKNAPIRHRNCGRDTAQCPQPVKRHPDVTLFGGAVAAWPRQRAHQEIRAASCPTPRLGRTLSNRRDYSTLEGP